MKCPWLRALPTLLVAILFLLSVFGPSRRARALPDPAPSEVTYAGCDTVIQQAAGDAVVALGPYAGVVQPIIPETNVASCSLGGVRKGDYDTGVAVIVEWDPLRLVPDPTVVALRARSFGVCTLGYSSILIGWSPPVILRRSEHLAEPPRTTAALEYVGYTGGQQWHYQAAGPQDAPVAYSCGPPPLSTPVPLPGSHPVLSHVVCGGDSQLQALAVVQSVVTTNTLTDTAQTQLLQRFRVPVETRLSWVELAFGTVSPRNPPVPGDIAILDAQGVDTPPVMLPTPLATAPVKSAVWTIPVWDSHTGRDLGITLEHDHDYWLLVDVTHCYGVYARNRTGTESMDFLAGIGGFHSRDALADSWTERPDQTLCFRLIGEPTGPIGVSPGATLSGGLRLRVAPNPARGASKISWSGAVGTVRIEVLDVRGRRVGAGTVSAGAVGDWSWRGAGNNGQRLPAGVYFVRAIDGAGRMAVQRLVLVR